MHWILHACNKIRDCRSDGQHGNRMTGSSGSKVQQNGPPPLKDGVDYINVGEEDQMEVYGYKKNTIYTVITWVCIFCTGGILRLVFHWWPNWMLFATHKKCPLGAAEKVLVVEMYQGKHKCYYVKNVATLSAEYILKNKKQETLDSGCWDDQVLTDMRDASQEKLSVHLSGGHFREVPVLRMFHCKKLRYVWDTESSEFLKLHGLDKHVNSTNLHCQGGLTIKEQLLRRVVYGSNEIVVPVRGVITLLFLEVLNPFYVFQLFSFCLWFADDYMYYAMAILAMSAFGITMAIIQTRENQRNLSSTVHSSDVATVIRGSNGAVETIPTEHLVPGDVLVIPPHGCILHCDAVLLTGNCILNESMLTGESVPVTKTPLPNLRNVMYDSKEHARHTLFCGTHIIQTRYFGSEQVLAVVIRTGFSTAKGDLVRSIMYPPPVDFKFEHDSYKFVELLACIASIGFIYTVITKHLRGISVSEIALEALDLITIVVPPALPAAMTVGRFYAQNRLRSKKVYCISPRTINVSGSIDCVCFDKTGTLTEDGLDMWGAVPSLDKKFQVPVKYIDKMEGDELLMGMVTCHSLTIIDGKLSGDPLDLKMFEATGWVLEEPEVNDNSKFDMIFPTVVKPPSNFSAPNNSPSENLQCGDNLQVEEFQTPLELGIVRQFPFSSSIQRMSVITRKLGDTQFNVYCKGSPEMIVSLSHPDSIPLDYSSVLEEYTQEGYRVLAIAYKGLPKVTYTKVQRIAREDVESNLIFLGLIIMENRLKPETTGIITMLREANIRTIMVTGDNVLTALSVARDCGIISHGQQVIEVHSVPAQANQAAQLMFTNSNYSIPPPVVNSNGGSIDLSNGVSSFETVESSTVNGTITGVTNEDPKNTIAGHINSADFCFAMTGRTWALAKASYPELIPKLATRGAVFARMSPDQKQQLIQELQALGYYVAMCGDGANDCGALKAAHAGISLSEAESSVASPFTSKEPNISCVPLVIREGRAALVTSFGIFKYMAAYSMTQFVTVMMLYSIDSNLTDIEFLYIDLFIITVFAFFFGRTEAFEGPLVKQPPILSLISLSPILSLLLQLCVVILIQWGSFYSVQQTSWFEPFNATRGEHESVACYENYALFTVSSMQYIILALVFSKGAPYRKSVFNNYGFLSALVILTAFTIYLILEPFSWLQSTFELMLPPVMDFRFIVLAFSFCNLVLAFIIEDGIVDYLVFKKLRYRFHNVDRSRRKFLAVDSRLQKDRSWPPITSKAILDSLLPSHGKSQPRANISEIHVECETLSNNTKLNSPSLMQGPITNIPRNHSESFGEVTLDPATLVSKRRYNSESENSSKPQEQNLSKSIGRTFHTSGFATLPRQSNRIRHNLFLNATVDVHNGVEVTPTKPFSPV